MEELTLRTAPDGRPENPLKAARTANRFSQQIVADEIGVTPQYIIRVEQGMYDHPPDELMQWLWDNDEHGYLGEERTYAFEWMADKYREFQHAQRRSYGPGSDGERGLGLVPHPESVWERTVLNKPHDSFNLVPHPLVWWRDKSLHVPSRIAVSKYYCVHPAIVFKFECQTHLLATPPDSLVVALLEAGFSKETLAWLEQAYYSYKRQRIDKAKA